MRTFWEGYEPMGLGSAVARADLSRAEARAIFEKFMSARADRIEMLARLLSANGLRLGRSDEAVQDLNNWFRDHVEPSTDEPGRLASRWYSVASDIALHLGEVMIERHPNLRWEFFTWGKRNVAYQRHVIMGFSAEDEKLRTNIDIERRIVSYAHQLIRERGSIPEYGSVEVRGVKVDVDAAIAAVRPRDLERDIFVRWLSNASDRA